MRAAAALLLVPLLMGCPGLPTRAELQGAGLMPSRTEPWCLPLVKYQRDEKRGVVGVRCAW